MLFKKKKTIIPEPPGYSPEEFGLEIPSLAREPIKEQAKEHEKFEFPKEIKPWHEHTFELLEEKKLQKPKEIFGDLEKHLEKPIFIHVENFKEIVESILSIDKKLQELEEIISKLEEVKQREAEKLEEWQQKIQELKEQLKILEKNFSGKL